MEKELSEMAVLFLVRFIGLCFLYNITIIKKEDKIMVILGAVLISAGAAMLFVSKVNS